MDPRDYWTAIRKSWIVVVVLGLVGLAAGYGYGHGKPDVYQSTSKVFVSVAEGSTIDQLAQGSTYTHALVSSYAELATTARVLDPVIDELGLSTTPTKLARSISSTSPTNTVFVEITVSDSTARGSASIANAVAHSLSVVAPKLSPSTKAGTEPVALSVVQPAQTPAGPRSPNRHLIDITALIIGLAVGVIVAIIRALVDTRIRSRHDLDRVLEAPVVGTIRRAPSEAAGLSLVKSPASARAEDFRLVGATLQYTGVAGSLESVLVASPLGGHDAADLALNLALATAERGKAVLVIDADLRSPQVGAATGVTSPRGLSDVIGGAKLEDAIQEWTGGVDVLVAGQAQSNPAFILGSSGLGKALDAAKNGYDLVVVVSPAILSAADSVTLVHQTEGALIAASARRTRRAQLVRAIETIHAVQASVLGVVLVDVKAPSREEHAATAHPATAPSTSAAPATGPVPVTGTDAK
ncbi:Wzz/FepE/Etk N-terminal domain-containing protein [Frondihabitans australicus]|uniref:Capsular polysaccharide biosynthesis protein n=1 Tax=Frondihabitans australicus TaxID=386892 RepID=A0A495ICB4_9MICO|nr:Wzz/FepE/Etk N-terminal domain-containing protein [Frondihabitans australicus]RKR72941.1 capsular polysaccharide biosynthesis protein [Frondihabitans australicus]